MSKIEVDAIDKQSGSTLTIGGSGTTVQLGTGASQTGFGKTGAVDWQTTKKTTSFTAVSGEGYFCDTAASGAFTLTLPSSPSAGAIVGLKDYNANFATANLTIGRNGSNLDGAASDKALNTNNLSLTLVYVDSTQGWVPIEEGTGFIGESFIEATGGTITTVCTNFKVHTFTGPGTFCVSQVASTAANNVVAYAVVAGGGAGGGQYVAGGGGGGGFREVKSPTAGCYTASPLDGYPTPGNRITVSAQGYPITVGGGGTGNAAAAATDSTPGNPSVFSTITSTGGGFGKQDQTNPPAPGSGGPGGSGGGGNGGSSNTRPENKLGGSGNTPPVSPAQGKDGGAGITGNASGGGGGATEVGVAGAAPSGGRGGAGATTSITGSSLSYAGGGGGGIYGPVVPAAGAASPCGTGGAATVDCAPGVAGTTNRGGGGGGTDSRNTTNAGGAGGSGVVIIRYKFQ